MSSGLTNAMHVSAYRKLSALEAYFFYAVAVHVNLDLDTLCA